MLDLVAHALELPVPAWLVSGEVAVFENLGGILGFILFGDAVEGEFAQAELTEDGEVREM